MALPNLVSPTTIVARKKVFLLTTSFQSLVAGETGKSKIIVSCVIANKHASTTGNVSAQTVESGSPGDTGSDGTLVPIAPTGSWETCGKPKFLEETDAYQAKCDANSVCDATVSWLEIS